MRTPSSSRPGYANGERAGFTLVELLLVVAVISMLAAILLPSISRARAAARDVKTASDLRQVMSAYVAYANESRGRLLPGYAPPTLDGEPVTVRSPSGHTFGSVIAQRYPWRLAPYLAWSWKTLFQHMHTIDEPYSGEPDAVAFNKAYTLSISPTFGLNSIYVGGHAGVVYNGFVASGTTYRANTGSHAVFRENEIRQPSRLIAFAEVQGRNTGSSDPASGYFFAMPPRARGEKWRVRNSRLEIVAPGVGMGLPEGRNTANTATGFVDGHVDRLLPGELADMTLWANKADTKDYDF